MYMRSGEVKLHMLAVTSSLSQRGRHSIQRGQQPIPLPTTISRSTKQQPQHQYHFPLSLIKNIASQSAWANISSPDE